MRNLMAAMLVAVLSASGLGASFQGLSYSTSGEVAAGKWTAQFAQAKSKARAANAPLVAVWVSPLCGYCTSLGSALAGSTVSKWAAKRGYYLVVGVMDTTSEAASVKSFAANSTGKYPYVGIWWPQKSGGEIKEKFSGRSDTMPVKSGSLAQRFMDSVDRYVGSYSGLPTKYALDVVCSPADGGKTSGTGFFLAGTSYTLRATAKSGFVFAGWFSGKNCLSQATTYKEVMGSANLSLTAKFIRKADDTVKLAAVKAADEYETKREIGDIALAATGGSLPTISVSKLPSGLKFTSKATSGHEANTIYGTPTRSGLYTAQISVRTAGGAKASASLPLVVRAKGERIVRVDCEAAKGKVSGGGVFADGKKASVQATAASKHCFTGWCVGGERVSRSTSYSYPVSGKDVTLTAEFVTKEADLASVALSVADRPQFTSVVVTNVVRCGLQLKLPVVSSALSGTTVTASGLPSGLKLVKTLVDKELKDYAYEISGTPSTPSKIDSKTGLVKPTVAKIKVTTLGKSAVTYQYAFVVEALPNWAYGSFSGFAAADEHGTGVGAASLTVSSAGKISGKFALFGTNWTYSVTGYAACERPDDPSRGKFRFEGLAKWSKLTRPFVVEVTPGTSRCAQADGEGDDWFMTLHRKVWSDKPALPSPKLKKTYLTAFGYVNTLAVTVSSSGSATFAGKLNDGTRVSSASALVFIDEKGLYKTYLIVPASKKFSGYIDEISIDSLK